MSEVFAPELDRITRTIPRHAQGPATMPDTLHTQAREDHGRLPVIRADLEAHLTSIQVNRSADHARQLQHRTNCSYSRRIKKVDAAEYLTTLSANCQSWRSFFYRIIYKTHPREEVCFGRLDLRDFDLGEVLTVSNTTCVARLCLVFYNGNFLGATVLDQLSCNGLL